MSDEKPKVRDELEEAREKMGIVPQSEALPAHLDSGMSVEARMFWSTVEAEGFGTIWNRPKIGDEVTLVGRPGVIGVVVERFERDEAVYGVRAQFADGTRVFAAPYQLRRVVVAPSESAPTDETTERALAEAASYDD